MYLVKFQKIIIMHALSNSCYKSCITLESWWISFGSTYIPLPQTHAGTLPPVNITGTRKIANITALHIGTIPDEIARVIIGYRRLDLGQPVVGEYGKLSSGHSKTFHSLVPGAKYRITAWGLGGGGSDTRRSRSPAVVEVILSNKKGE